MATSKSKSDGGSLKKIEIHRDISPQQAEELLTALQTRFDKNPDRHESIEWRDVATRLENQPEKLATLHAMEATGGEPDVVGYDSDTKEYIFYDCAEQSPDGRRSICYDGPAEQKRHKKGVYPSGNALDLAATIGIEILTEAQYRALQELGEFDTKTSSWVQTAPAIHDLGGAIFCDRRYDHVFTYHNGATSFYAARGFRGCLRV